MDFGLWFKALHIISIIAWMAGLLYLPRLYVYHAGAKTGSELSETLKVMERRLLRFIMNPAMIAAWIFGLLTAYFQGQFSDAWLHGKLLFVVALSVVHMMLARYRREFEADQRQRSAKFFRVINEVPTVLMIVIVFLVVLKPF
ncbi:MAG: membrane protein [Rhodomicrobium sp.]|nr:MAG: membrane protein [Rhodomicrobium sp.]